MGDETPMKILFLSSGSRVPFGSFSYHALCAPVSSRGHRVKLLIAFPRIWTTFLGWISAQSTAEAECTLVAWLQAKLRNFDVVYIDREIFDDDTWRMEDDFAKYVGNWSSIFAMRSFCLSREILTG